MYTAQLSRPSQCSIFWQILIRNILIFLFRLESKQTQQISTTNRSTILTFWRETTNRPEDQYIKVKVAARYRCLLVT